MKKLWLYLILIFSPGIVLFGQVTYEVSRNQPVQKSATIDLQKMHDPFMVSLEPVEAPQAFSKESKRFLQQQKIKAQKRFPRQESVKLRSSLDMPDLLDDFSANNWTSRTPLDNHLAISNDGQIVSVINTHMLVMSNTGFWQFNTTLENFYDDVSSVQRIFDPRVMYDPKEDRWVIVMMNGDVCPESELLFAFSNSSDAKGSWNLYKFDGCPFENMTFADYPMISLIGDELFFTYNGVRVNEPWQTGFEETLIIQIDKMAGYAGSELISKTWSNIRMDGRNIRNLCPVKNATEELPEQAYFLSNRNFDLQNDSIFILEVTGDLNDPSSELLVDVKKADQPYGVPPNAVQPIDSLQTNDARILDAFLLDNRIQFVGNTMDFETGLSAVYHGKIDDVVGNRNINGWIINGGEDYLGYPGIAYTGIEPGEEDAIIIASHASFIRNPGYSALYTDGMGGYSDWLTIKEGQKNIDMFESLIVERWGDYCGIQRLYNQPGVVWVSASYGKSDRRNNTWVGNLGRPEMNVGFESQINVEELRISPNPSMDFVDLTFNLANPSRVNIKIHSASGQLVKVLYDHFVDAGDHILHFTTNTLDDGIYVLSVQSGQEKLLSEQIVVQR